MQRTIYKGATFGAKLAQTSIQLNRSQLASSKLRHCFGVAAFNRSSFEENFAKSSFKDKETLINLYNTRRFGLLYDRLIQMRTDSTEENEEYITVLNGLADTCIRLEQWKSAEQSFEKIVEVRNQLLTGSKESRRATLVAYRNWVTLFLEVEVDKVSEC